MCLHCLAHSFEILFCNIGGDHWAQNYWSWKKARRASFSSVFFLCLTKEGKKNTVLAVEEVSAREETYHWNFCLTVFKLFGMFFGDTIL